MADGNYQHIFSFYVLSFYYFGEYLQRWPTKVYRSSFAMSSALATLRMFWVVHVVEKQLPVALETRNWHTPLSVVVFINTTAYEV